MYYDKDVQAKVKQYCRDLLAHQNPYRESLRRVDDPGIALVEMLNENYFTKQGYDLYQRLPKRFQDSFVVAWNEWLQSRYGTTLERTKTWSSNQL